METLGDLLTVIVGSSITAALVGPAASALADHLRARKQRKHLCLLIAFRLEAYAALCATKASDHVTYEGSDGNMGAAIERVPDSPALPESGGYEHINPTILNDLFSLPQRVSMAVQQAHEAFDELGDYGAHTEISHRHTITLGCLAFEIAERLRDTYGLPPRSLQVERWDPVTYLRAERDRLSAPTGVATPVHDLSAPDLREGVS